jgi:hypothetical protein
MTQCCHSCFSIYVIQIPDKSVLRIRREKKLLLSNKKKAEDFPHSIFSRIHFFCLIIFGESLLF